MKKFALLFVFIWSISVFSQYTFPPCSRSYVNGDYTQGDIVSLNNKTYQAKYWTNTSPPSADWKLIGSCGSVDAVLGPAYPDNKRIIGYLPSWQSTYDYNLIDPSKVTNIVVSFVTFKVNNNDYNSSDFASIAFDAQKVSEVDNILTTKQILAKSHNVNTKVSVAIGGAEDYGFLWLMKTYYNNDTKIQEIAKLIVDYATAKGIDGIDLDMECWWQDPAILGTADLGGRTRGDKWGGVDQGPRNEAIGLKNLAQKIKALNPNLLVSAAVFGTSWYGNNYDDSVHNYVDWLGLMTYDFTGSWTASPIGPHTALYKLPLSSYEKQNADNPIYSAQDALDFWLGLAEPAWNHDGGFNVPRNKLCIGGAFYAYDMANLKTVGNGYAVAPYKTIATQYANADISYDPVSLNNYSGYINQNGSKWYYETPKSITGKYNYTKTTGLQGIILWELTNDLPVTNTRSLLYNLYQATQTANLSAGDVKTSENPSVLVYSQNSLRFLFPDSQKRNIKIYDTTGKQIFAFTTSDKSGITPLPYLSSGIYIANWGKMSKKFIVAGQ